MGIEKEHKIIVGGTGRTGSTVFMALFSYLELGTGYGKHSYMNEEINKSFFFEGSATGYIIKDHEHTAKDVSWLDQWNIDYYIWLKRELSHVAQSRINRWDRGYWRGGLDPETKGDPNRQLMITMQRYYRIEDYLKANPHIPVIPIKFPDFVNDKEYFYNQMLRPFPNLDKKKFDRAFELIIKPDMVNAK